MRCFDSKAWGCWRDYAIDAGWTKAIRRWLLSISVGDFIKGYQDIRSYKDDLRIKM